MMIVEFKIEPETLSESSSYDISDIADVTGSISIKTNVKDIVSEPTPVLIDITQIVNSMTFSAMEKCAGKTMPILLDLEPRLYIHYGDALSLYEYRPDEECPHPNPVLEIISQDAAARIADELWERVTRQLRSSNTTMLRFYETLLLP